MRTHGTSGRLRTLVVWALALSSSVVASCAREPVIEKTRLGRLPPTYKPGSVGIADDGRSYAFVDVTPAGDRIVTRRGASEPHTICTRPVFAPKTGRMLYWTIDEVDGRRLVHLVDDGAAIPTDFVAAGTITFSDDGTRFAALGISPANEASEVGAVTLHLDGTTTVRHDDAGTPDFSKDGRHVAYLAADGGRVALVVDGTSRHTFDPPTAPCAVTARAHADRPDLPVRHALHYLADGGLLALTRDADGWGLYRDGRRLASYVVNRADKVDPECRTGSVIAPGSIRTAADAPVGVWWERAPGDATRDRLWRVARNGAPLDEVVCSEPWYQQPPEVSADGAHVAYACRLRDQDNLTQSFVIKDGHRYGPYQEIWGIELSNDGSHVSYGATRGGELIPRPWDFYVDGAVRAHGFAATWRPRFAPDGTTIAWQAKRRDDGRGFLGIGDRILGRFDEILWGPMLETATPGPPRFVWVIRRGRTLSRLTVPVGVAATPHPRVRLQRGDESPARATSAASAAGGTGG